MKLGILKKLRIKRVASQPDDLQKIRTAFLREADQILEDRDSQGNPMLKINIGSHVLIFHFTVNDEGEAKFRDVVIEKRPLILDWNMPQIERR